MLEDAMDKNSTKLKKKMKKEKKLKKEKKEKKSKKEKKEKKSSKRKRNLDQIHDVDGSTNEEGHVIKRAHTSQSATDGSTGPFSFPIKYILAPMVGASELPFRLLCRKYGAQLCYTPMMSSSKFIDPEYRKEEFQTIPEDRPLVCHFSANDPQEFTQAGKLVENICDAIDLNLGCPQRTAYLGHFGSYLLDPKDRKLICDIVRTASQNVSVPIFVKIRLLDTINETIELCQQLKDAGAALICIHARYRASFERKGPGARDGPALLDKIVEVRKALGPDFPIIANGNVISFEDVQKNMEFTQAHGIMSAEGLLDDPCLFFPRYSMENKTDIAIAEPSLLPNDTEAAGENNDAVQKLIRKLSKKLREIEAIERKKDDETLTKEQKEKLSTKSDVEKKLAQAMSQIRSSDRIPESSTGGETTSPKLKTIPLKELQKAAGHKPTIAMEYLNLTERYPTKLRTVIFHTRRILKQELNTFQLMEDCINSKSIQDIRKVIDKVTRYLNDPSSFKFDKAKAEQEKEAMERKKREEGKRKDYEARMLRKAKREGLQDREFYLRQGSIVPTVEEIESLLKLPRELQLKKWKEHDHLQHCMGFHLDPGGCKRDRACAFLHVDAMGKNNFVEMDEVAG